MEYKVLSGPFNACKLEKDLNGHAAEGWRVAAPERDVEGAYLSSVLVRAGHRGHPAHDHGADDEDR